jgi:hypothetical protein
MRDRFSAVVVLEEFGKPSNGPIVFQEQSPKALTTANIERL